LYLWGWTQQEIGEKVGLERSSVTKIVNNTDFGKIHNEVNVFLSQGQPMSWIAEHYSIDMQLAWA